VSYVFIVIDWMNHHLLLRLTEKYTIRKLLEKEAKQ
jgi:hypothetical protein